jgi:hypothetical protein
MRLVSPAGPSRFSPGAIVTVARTVPPVVAAIALLAATPAVIVAATGGHGFAIALSVASLVAGAGVGFAADDPAAPTLASSPTTLAVRRLLRAALIGVVLGAGWLAAVLVAARYGQPGPDLHVLAAELCAAGALSGAVGARARTDAPVTAGFGAAAASLLLMVAVAMFSARWSVLPSLGGGTGHARWWWIAAAGSVAAAWFSRDPALRPRLGKAG